MLLHTIYVLKCSKGVKMCSYVLFFVFKCVHFIYCEQCDCESNKAMENSEFYEWIKSYRYFILMIYFIQQGRGHSCVVFDGRENYACVTLLCLDEANYQGKGLPVRDNDRQHRHQMVLCFNVCHYHSVLLNKWIERKRVYARNVVKFTSRFFGTEIVYLFIISSD